MTTPNVPSQPSQFPQPTNQPNKSMGIILALVGFVWVLGVGGVAFGIYYLSHQETENQAEGTQGSQPTPNLPPATGPGPLSNPATGAGTDPTPSPAPGPGPIPTPDPVKPNAANFASLLGKQGDIDSLEAPADVPEGILAFIAGLNLLNDFRPQEAIPYFDKAILSNGQKGDYYAVRGAACVLALKVDQGIPDLRRAFSMCEDTGPLKRLLRLAYLMKNDSANASKYRLSIMNRSDIDSLIEEIGRGISTPDDRPQYELAVKKLSLVSKLVYSTYWQEKYGTAIIKVGVELLHNGNYAQAQSIFADAVAQNPANPTFVYYYARALMETGNIDLARRELTFVLCWKRFLPEAYAARAICAARKNDAARANADLEMARKLSPAKAAEAEAPVAQMQRLPAPESAEKVAQRLDTLLTLAKTRPSFEQLVNEALQLKRAVDAHRRRFEEYYQTTLLEKCLDARAHPGDADKLAEMANFIWDNRDNYAVQIVPRGPTQYFRFGAVTQEVQFVYDLAMEGLNCNPQSGYCLALKADFMLFKKNNLEEAAQYAQMAVDYAPRLPRAYMSLSNCYEEYRARLLGNAKEFRGAKWATIRESDGHGNYRDVQRMVQPSAEDLAKAADCERQAAQYEKKEQACLDAAVTSAKGTPEEIDYQAQIFYLRKNYADARACLEKAVREKPTDFRSQMGLAKCLKLMGLTEEFNEVYERALSLQETTALECLRVAFQRIEASDWEGARKMLLRAQEYDPSNAIILVYRGIVAELGGKDTAEAEACFQAALALEEARARANKSSFLPGTATPLLLGDADLTIMLRLKLARYCFTRNPAAAAELYLANVELEQRIGAWALSRPVSAGLFPNPQRLAKDQPPTALVTALKFNRLFAAQALTNSGKPSEAAVHHREGTDFLFRLPSERAKFENDALDPQFMLPLR